MNLTIQSPAETANFSSYKKAITFILQSLTLEVTKHTGESRIMTEEPKGNDSSMIIAQALDEMKKELGSKFDPDKINLAELERRTGISRAKLRRIKSNGFTEKPNGNTGRSRQSTVISGYSGVINGYLSSGVTNSVVIFERIRNLGYRGSLSTVKRYVASHKSLVPAKRQAVDPQGNRGRRYETGPGESYQMDWGFVNVTDHNGDTYQAACFAMICHHCGERYIEFFPNATQESLFIGMIHAFMYMGIPRYILTDNMKSVVVRRDVEGHPIWNHDYEVFMKAVGFMTKLCKPRHPFTKGAVERLVRFVKDNFLAGRTFLNVTDLNYEALRWCSEQNGRYHRAIDCIPAEKHARECLNVVTPLERTLDIAFYLCPERKISFDGFVNYEGHRFGVPYWYTRHTCRLCRDQDIIYIYSDDLSKVLTSHDVTWSKHDSYCHDQYTKVLPEEVPSVPVKTLIRQLEPAQHDSGFSKFNFDREDL